MATKIQKWGNSLAIRLPKYVTDTLNLKENDPVTIKLDTNKLLIMPDNKNEYNLHQLLDRITENNIHPESGFGHPEGAEQW